MEIGTWRKFNALQNYIQKNFGDGEDINCKDIPMSKGDIEELLKILKKVNKDHSLAEELLPCTTGFFYGGQEYDEYYFDDIKNSIKIFKQALKDCEDNTIVYSCWY